jgi:hypothetical protein
MRDIKQPRMRPHMPMLGHDAIRVIQRHGIASKRHHFAASVFMQRK